MISAKFLSLQIDDLCCLRCTSYEPITFFMCFFVNSVIFSFFQFVFSLVGSNVQSLDLFACLGDGLVSRILGGFVNLVMLLLCFYFNWFYFFKGCRVNLQFLLSYSFDMSNCPLDGFLLFIASKLVNRLCDCIACLLLLSLMYLLHIALNTLGGLGLLGSNSNLESSGSSSFYWLFCCLVQLLGSVVFLKLVHGLELDSLSLIIGHSQGSKPKDKCPSFHYNNYWSSTVWEFKT